MQLCQQRSIWDIFYKKEYYDVKVILRWMFVLKMISRCNRKLVLGKERGNMTNVIIYDIIQKKGYGLQKLVDAFDAYLQDDTQGIIINEYDETFLKATYWQKKIQKSYRFNLEKKDFDVIEEEIVNIVDFGIEIENKKLLIFGNKQMAQRIITMISVVSENAYSITEFVINIESLIRKVCMKPDIVLVKMKLSDITIEKGVLVDCSVNLITQDEPKELALKYANNIVVISFRLEDITSNITVYKSGKISIGRVSEDEKDELIENIIRIVG